MIFLNREASLFNKAERIFALLSGRPTSPTINIHSKDRVVNWVYFSLLIFLVTSPPPSYLSPHLPLCGIQLRPREERASLALLGSPSLESSKYLYSFFPLFLFSSESHFLNLFTYASDAECSLVKRKLVIL